MVQQVTWLSGCFVPQSFLTAVLQTTARKHDWPLDRTVTQTEVTRYAVGDVKAHSKDGVYVTGLYLEVGTRVVLLMICVQRCCRVRAGMTERCNWKSQSQKHCTIRCLLLTSKLFRSKRVSRRTRICVRCTRHKRGGQHTSSPLGCGQRFVLHCVYTRSLTCNLGACK